MADYSILDDPNWQILQEKLNAFIESHKQKWDAYRTAIKEKQSQETIWHLYQESEIAWKSIEDTKKEMWEFSSKYPH